MAANTTYFIACLSPISNTGIKPCWKSTKCSTGRHWTGRIWWASSSWVFASHRSNFALATSAWGHVFRQSPQYLPTRRWRAIHASPGDPQHMCWRKWWACYICCPQDYGTSSWSHFQVRRNQPYNFHEPSRAYLVQSFLMEHWVLSTPQQSKWNRPDIFNRLVDKGYVWSLRGNEGTTVSKSTLQQRPELSCQRCRVLSLVKISVCWT